MFTYAKPFATLVMAAAILASLVAATLLAPNVVQSGVRTTWTPSARAIDAAVAELAQPLFGIKGGRRSFTRPPAALHRP